MHTPLKAAVKKTGIHTLMHIQAPIKNEEKNLDVMTRINKRKKGLLEIVATDSCMRKTHYINFKWKITEESLSRTCNHGGKMENEMEKAINPCSVF